MIAVIGGVIVVTVVGIGVLAYNIVNTQVEAFTGGAERSQGDGSHDELAQRDSGIIPSHPGEMIDPDASAALVSEDEIYQYDQGVTEHLRVMEPELFGISVSRADQIDYNGPVISKYLESARQEINSKLPTDRQIPAFAQVSESNTGQEIIDRFTVKRYLASHLPNDDNINSEGRKLILSYMDSTAGSDGYSDELDAVRGDRPVSSWTVKKETNNFFRDKFKETEPKGTATRVIEYKDDETSEYTQGVFQLIASNDGRFREWQMADYKKVESGDFIRNLENLNLN